MRLKGTLFPGLIIFVGCLIFIHPVYAFYNSDYSDDFYSWENAEDQPYELKVALYPFITDVNHDNNTYLLSMMKQQFQRDNPSINLTVMIDSHYDCYDLNRLPEIFSENGPQLIEADLSLLGHLVEGGYLKPYEDLSLEENILPNAIPAGRFLEETYAIPTWVCSQFLFSRDPSVMDIHNVEDLSMVFQDHQSEYSRMLVSDFQGGDVWMIPMLYVFAYTDNQGYSRKIEGVFGPVNVSSVSTMTETMDWCSVDGNNDCLNGYFSIHSPTKVFAQNDAYSYNGFSENLYNIRRTDKNSTFFVIPTPFGEEQNPLIWVDGLMINKNACDDECMEAVSEFVIYYNSLQVKNMIAFSEDAYGSSPPRYVLPATEDFYFNEKAETNPYYRDFGMVAQSAESFPNSGIVENIRERYQVICEIIREKIPDTECLCIQ